MVIPTWQAAVKRIKQWCLGLKVAGPSLPITGTLFYLAVLSAAALFLKIDVHC